MPKLAWIVALAALAIAPAAAETALLDLRGTWKGESESIILGSGNPHHPATQASEPRLTSVAFTLAIDKQEGRRFSGTFSSPRHSETVIAVVSRAGTIFMVDDDGCRERISGNGDDENRLNKSGSRTGLDLGHGSLIRRRRLLCGQKHEDGRKQSQGRDDVALHSDLGNHAARVSLVRSIGR